MEGDWPVKSILPLCPGHEGVGIVEEVDVSSGLLTMLLIFHLLRSDLR